jgi:hypothetical protein
MTFAEYYRSNFRGDLEKVVRSAPSPNHFSEGAHETELQPRVISRHNQAVRLLPDDRRALFGVALFFTVLVDQVCYTYFRGYYPRFQVLTRYPKFKGDCPGACGHHLHPRDILSALGKPPERNEWGVVEEYRRTLADATPVMEREVFDFFREQMPEVDAVAFWTRCLAAL